MTVGTQITKRIHAGNDAATVFGFDPLTIYESTNLVVVHTTAAGIETTLSEGTGPSAYAVVPDTGYPGTGSIRYPEDAVIPLPTGEIITIKRVLTVEQATDLENQGGYYSETHEVQFDKFIMIDLQQDEELQRSFKFPVSFTGGIDVETDTPTANSYLRINEAGTAMEWATLTGGLGAAYDNVPELVDFVVGSPGVLTDYARGDHSHELVDPIPIANGGTGSSTAPAARTALGLGTAAIEDAGVADGNVPQMDAVGYPAADGSQITDLGNAATVTTITAAQGASRVLLASYSPSAVASVDITSVLTSAYTRYMIEVTELKPATNDVALWTRLSIDNGATWRLGGTDYHYIVYAKDTTSDLSVSSTGDTHISLCTTAAGDGVGNLSNESVSCTIELVNPLEAGTIRKMVQFRGSYITANALLTTFSGAGVMRASILDPVDAIQILFESGNIASGEIRVYGIKDA